MGIRSASLLAGALLLAPSVARADVIRVELTSTIAAVPAGLESQFSVGELVRGSFEYDTESLDSHPDPDLGHYPAADLDAEFGTYVASSSTGLAEVNLSSAVDHFSAAASTSGAMPDPVVGDPVGDFTLVALVFRVSDDTETFFADDSLPLDLPLASFSGSEALLTFQDSSAALAFLTASPLDSIVTTVVPEPASRGLPLAALAALGGLRPGRHRRSARRSASREAGGAA